MAEQMYLSSLDFDAQKLCVCILPSVSTSLEVFIHSSQQDAGVHHGPLLQHCSLVLQSTHEQLLSSPGDEKPECSSC